MTDTRRFWDDSEPPSGLGSWLRDLDPDRPFRPLIVGEADPRRRDPEEALVPVLTDRRDSGYRLCCLIFGLRVETYLDRFDRTNVFEYDPPPEPWDRETYGWARTNVGALGEVYEERDVLILLGKRVARAFRIETEDPIERHRHGIVVLPHPSQRNRVWSLPGIHERVRQVMREECPWIPFGEAL